MTTQPVNIYGMMLSGNTARVRSYLINANIPFRDKAPSSHHYLSKVVPLAGGVRTMPTLEFSDGRVIRDGAAIIDHFEQQSGHSFSPRAPKQRFFSRLFDAIGSEGLLRPGMHYRWNFDAENLPFLRFHNRKVMPPGDFGIELVEQAEGQMRKATRKFGVNPDTYNLIEELYSDQLAALDQHFAIQPYLLGGRPCIGDFGMMIMLFPHLGRDPKPRALMLEKGLNVLRWTERMNIRGADFDGFERQDETYLDDDEIPDTLLKLLAVMAEDFVPETLAAADFINQWLEEQEDLVAGTPCARGVGFAEFDIRGETISALAQPYRFYLLKRAQDEYAEMAAADKKALDANLESCNMTALLDAKLTRQIGRKDNLEIWL